MKKVIIKNLAGIQTHGAEMENPSAWIAECIDLNVWGKPERWIPHKEEGGIYDESEVIDERLEEVILAVPFQPEIPAVYDGGNLIADAIPARPEIPAVIQKQVKLKAQYTIEIQDISQQLEKERINNNSLAYLAATDWLIIREIDSGVECPAEIKTLRQAAREAIIK